MADDLDGLRRAAAGPWIGGDCLRALFPSGVSDRHSQKLRAMQIISELETETARRIHWREVRFFSQNESVCGVAIRTIELKGATPSWALEAGLSSIQLRQMSIPGVPVEGTDFVRRRQPEFELIGGLLWSGGIVLEVHLDRLEESAGCLRLPL